MGGTKRIPLPRHPATQITPRAVELFEAMGKLLCTCVPKPNRIYPDCTCPGCERWSDLQGLLNDELRCKPWQWPAVSRQGAKHAGSTCMNERIAETMRILRQAVKEKRAQREAARVQREAEADAPVLP